MEIKKIYVGSWFQRTTLHLSEIYDFLESAESPLDLDKTELKNLRSKLQVKSFDMVMGELEHVEVFSKSGVKVELYEDGLISISKDFGGDVRKDVAAVTAYYEKALSPALKYLFSLGAPIPKELANIKNIYPYFVVIKNGDKDNIEKVFADFKEKKYYEIKGDGFEIYRGNTLYIINNLTHEDATIEKFIEEQVFMREFKVQLHRYLNLHRIIWEKIEGVIDRGKVKGKDVGVLKYQVERYAKTINLIDARINQMGTFISTRGSIAIADPALASMFHSFQHKYETLSDTLEYVKEVWSMTQNYVDSALRIFSELEATSTDSSVENLTVVTSMGVGATLLGLFAADALPTVTLTGIAYFLILAAIGYTAKKIIGIVNKRRSYEISDVEVDTDIK